MSVLCIVLVIAAIVGAGLYFGVIDKDDSVGDNLHKVGQQLHDSGKEILSNFKN